MDSLIVLLEGLPKDFFWIITFFCREGHLLSSLDSEGNIQFPLPKSGSLHCLCVFCAMFIHSVFIYSVRMKLSRVFLWYSLDQLLLCCFLFCVFLFLQVCIPLHPATSDLAQLSNCNSLEVKRRRKTNRIRRDNRILCKRKSNMSWRAEFTTELWGSDIKKISEKNQ